VSEIKAGVAGMVDKNGKPGADQFKIVADQIRAAADQLKAGLHEPVSDHSSVALNQVFAQTRVPVRAVPSSQSSAESPQAAEPKPGTIPSTLDHGGNGSSKGASVLTESRAIDLVSAVTDRSVQAPPVDLDASNQGPGAPPIIDLSSPAADPPNERQPQGSSKTTIGASIALPREASVGRMGEAYPERPAMEPMANGASKNHEGAEASLGMFLLASREKRVVTREDAARDTRIPAHYLRMMESNDYSMIADQLYLLPFLRRYSEYLGLDSEDVAIRFVREVQRAENNPGPTLPSTRGEAERDPSNLWAILGALAVIALIAGWMVLHQRHHPGGDETADISPQRSAMTNDNSGPPLPESVQGSIQSDDTQQTVQADDSKSASPPPSPNHPVSQPPAQTQRIAPAHSANEAIPPPGGTE
jgi:cytoskeletal protein RodZ